MPKLECELEKDTSLKVPCEDIANCQNRPVEAKTTLRSEGAPQDVSTNVSERSNAVPEDQQNSGYYASTLNLNLCHIKHARGNIASDAAPSALSEDRLHKFWDEMVTSMRSKAEWKEFAELLLDKEVRMNGDVEIVIESSNSHFETLFKPQQVVVLEWLRRRTCIPNLMITVAVKASTQEKTSYIPQDKYNDMFKKNSNISYLKEIFQELDY